MERQVEFKSGKDTLRGKIFIPEGKGPFSGIIFFHGSGSSGDTYFEASERLVKKGFLTFMFNFRGCGISDGDFKKQTINMGVEDAMVGLEYFLNLKELDKNHIGIAGSSFGGFLAALFSSEIDFKSMVLIVPAAYAPSQLNKFHGEDKHHELNEFEKSKSYLNIKKYKNSLLIVQSEFDDTLPKGMVEKYVESGSDASRKEHIILKDTKHRIKLNPEAKKILLKKLDSWFLETL